MDMQTMIQREIVCAQVGQAIFCTHCEQVLDAPRAVAVDLVKGGQTLYSLVMCGACYARRDAGYAGLAEKLGAKLEVYDGRQLWPAKRPRRALRYALRVA